MDLNFEETKTAAAVAAELAFRAAGLVGLDVDTLNAKGEAYTRSFVTFRGQHGEHQVREVTDPNVALMIRPARTVGGVTVQTQDSLVAYARDFKDSSSRLFADIARNRIVCFLDFHQGETDAMADHANNPRVALAPDVGVAGFLDHVATLDLPFSEEWATWTKSDGVLMEQVEFARFLQENSADVEAPDAATLIECARDLRSARNVNFTAEVNMNSENDSFEYTDKTDVNRRNALDVPSEFALRLPVYFGGRATGLRAMLRHKVEEGRLRLGYKLLRREAVRQATFMELVSDVSERSGLPVVYGSVNERSVDRSKAIPAT